MREHTTTSILELIKEALIYENIICYSSLLESNKKKTCIDKFNS